MAAIIPTFEQVFIGSGNITSETWVDVSGAITSGKQLWVGYASLTAPDKTLQFELRPNIAGQSTGTTGNTQLRSITSVIGGESKDADFYFYGNILTLAPVSAVSTGVEKLWLRVKSGSNSAATFEYMIFYTVY